MLKKLIFASTCALASLCFLSERTLAQLEWRCATDGFNQAYASTQQEAYNKSLSLCASNTLPAAGEPSPCRSQNVVCQQTGLQPQPQQPQPPRPQPQPQPPQATRLVPLKSYWSPQRRDHFTLGTQESESSAAAAGYKFVRVEACVFPTQQPGTVPLKSYWSPQRQEHFTTGTQVGESSAIAAGYRFVRIEGYVYPSSQNQSTVLVLLWSASRNDNFTLSNGDSFNSALQAGYKEVRAEGYAAYSHFQCK